MASLERDMTGAARDLLGPGYVSDYYRNAASEFIQIAEGHIAAARKPAPRKPSNLPAIKALQDRMAEKLAEARKSRKRLAPGPTSHFFEGQIDVLEDLVTTLKALT